MPALPDTGKNTTWVAEEIEPGIVLEIREVPYPERQRKGGTI
jgi:hypothetical protein